MRIRPLLISTLAVVGCKSDGNDGGAAPKLADPPDRRTSAETHVTSKDGTRIAYERVGRGPAVIVVSGALSHRALLRDNALAPKLGEHFTVYTYDRRGRGESTDTKPYAVQREIEDLDALIAKAGAPVFVFGTSSGAALAMQAAAKLGPTKIARLALYEPPYGQDPAAFAKQKAGVAQRVATGKPGDAAELFMTAIGTPPDAMAAMKKSPQWPEMAKMDFTLNYDFAILGDGAIPEDTVRAVEVPTLVMNGDKSMPFMQPTAGKIAAALRHGQHKTLAGQTHQVEADAVVPVLARFFGYSVPSVRLRYATSESLS